MAQACQESCHSVWPLMVFAALHLKMMIKGIKLSGMKMDGKLPGASEGFLAVREQHRFIFHSHYGLRARSRAAVLCRNTVGRSTQTLNFVSA